MQHNPGRLQLYSREEYKKENTILDPFLILLDLLKHN